MCLLWQNQSFPQKISTPKNRFKVLAVGRFVYMKGFDITIRAFAEFYKKLPSYSQKNCQLQLVGKGEELKKIQQLILDEGIANCTKIIPWVEKNEMDKIYQTSSVFCFGSHEGAGMVVPEALSYGIPVICFDNYGPGELCNNSCAIKIPYSTYKTSIQKFSKALERMYYNKKTHALYSKNAYDYAKENFTWNVKANLFRTAYN